MALRQTLLGTFALVLTATTVVTCGGSADPSRPASTASPSTRVPDAQELLGLVREAVLTANTGTYSSTVDFGYSSVVSVGAYSTQPLLATSLSTQTGGPMSVLETDDLAGRRDPLGFENISTKNQFWLRYSGLGSVPVPTCWGHVAGKRVAQIPALTQPTPALGSYPVLAALYRSVRPVMVDSHVMEVRGNLYDIAAQVPEEFVDILRIPEATRRRVVVQLELTDGEIAGWKVDLGDIVVAALDAGYPDLSDINKTEWRRYAQRLGEMRVVVREIGGDVEINPPTRDTFDLSLDASPDFSEDMGACRIG